MDKRSLAHTSWKSMKIGALALTGDLVQEKEIQST